MKPKPKPVRIRKENKKNLIDFKWVGIITLLAFGISLVFSIISQSVITSVEIIFSVILVLAVIFLGVIFDMVGVAVTVADSKVFHAMAAKNIKGARTAIQLIKNAPKVSSICNDVVGDICGIISGSGGTAIAAVITIKLGVNVLIPTLIITALIASLTIGGKALGKGIAVARANYIIEKFSKLLSLFGK